MEKMAVVHFTTIQCGPNKAHKSTKKAIFNFAIFVPLLTTLCMLGLNVFVRFYESSVLVRVNIQLFSKRYFKYTFFSFT